MAGIYIHIPFCKQACHYCNFHFSTGTKHHEDLHLAILKEIDAREREINELKLDTIYFGGGTPSLWPAKKIKDIVDRIVKYVSVEKVRECTLEANPDDLNPQYLSELRTIGVDRLSIGIQSFFDADLQWMNRVHNSKSAHNSIELAKAAGFEKITIDLIFGSPTTTDKMWQENLEIFKNYALPHLSAYMLTAEPKTALQYHIDKGQVQLDENSAKQQFKYLMDWATGNSYDHYEISNFCLTGHRAIHNSSYWEGRPYIGFGPGAHSFNGANRRRWNVANNLKYIKAIEEGTDYFEEEILTAQNQYNEYVMTALRRKEGISSQIISDRFTKFADHFEKEMKKIGSELIQCVNNNYILTAEGKLLADSIMAQLFWVS